MTVAAQKPQVAKRVIVGVPIRVVNLDINWAFCLIPNAFRVHADVTMRNQHVFA
jgi:hypothetical protein